MLYSSCTHMTTVATNGLIYCITLSICVLFVIFCEANNKKAQCHEQPVQGLHCSQQRYKLHSLTGDIINNRFIVTCHAYIDKMTWPLNNSLDIVLYQLPIKIVSLSRTISRILALLYYSTRNCLWLSIVRPLHHDKLVTIFLIPYLLIITHGS